MDDGHIRDAKRRQECPWVTDRNSWNLYLDKTTSPHTHLRAGLFTGVEAFTNVFLEIFTDYRLYIFPQIETPDQPTGGCISGTEKNKSHNLFLSGQNNPEIYF